MSRSALNTLVAAKVLTGGRRTTAANEREVYNAIIAEAVNNVDDADVAGGYMKISAAGRVDTSFIKAASAAGKFLRDDGTWQIVATGSSDLASVLTAGNSTGDIAITSEDAGIELRVQDGGNGYFISSVGVVGVTNSPFVNPNKLQLSEDGALIGHDTAVYFDAPVYNFTNVTGNTYAYFDASGNLISGVTPASGLSSVLAISGVTGNQPIKSANNKSQLFVYNAGSSLFYFDGSESTGVTVNSGNVAMTYDNSSTLETGTMNLTIAGAEILHSVAVFAGTDNGVTSAYSAYTPLTARLTYYNATNSGGIRIEDAQNYIDHTQEIVLDSPVITIAQALLRGANTFTTLDLGPTAAVLSYDDGAGTQAFVSANNSQIHWAWSNGVNSADVSADATSLTLYHSGFVYIPSAIQAGIIRDLSGVNSINTGRFLYDPSVSVSVDWGNRYLRDSAAAVSIDWDGKSIYSDWTMASGFLTLYADPTSAMHAATKSYVDNAVAGLIFIRQCNAASTANVTISSAPASLDGVAGVSGVSRWLLKDQTLQTENGVYLFNGTGVALTRVTDADSGGELANKTVPVVSGSTLADTWWTCINDTITIGVTNIVFTQTAGSGTYTNGAGLTLTGNVFSISAGAITNAMLAGSIAYSKLNLTNEILNADLAGGISYSKLNLTGAILNADLAGSIAYSKLSLTGAILNADLAGSIADGKLASSYLYADGTRALTGNWNVGAFSITAKLLSMSGTGGAGYLESLAQSSNVSAPSAAGFRLFAGATGSFNWVRKNGSDTYVRTFDATLTADRVYTLQDSSDTVVMRATTDTLTNKRLQSRTGTVASSATPTINTDNVDYFSITALAANITSFTTNLSGTPSTNDTLWIAITDNGTARTLSWGASFEASGTISLPTTTVISTRLDVGFVWNEVTSKWRICAVQ